MNNKPTIIYLGSVEVPSQSAASRRIVGNAKAIQAAGYNVLIGGAQEGSEGYIEHEGIQVYQVGERKYENLPTALKYLAYTRMGRLTLDWLSSLNCEIAAIVLYSGYSPYLFKLLPWCRAEGIPLVFDAVEWYEAPSKLQAIFNPYFWNIELAMRYLIPKTHNVICISSYLQNHFDESCNTVIVPPLLEVATIDKDTNTKEHKTIVSYTGSPGKKDLLDKCLAAVFNINSNEHKPLEFVIAGLTEQDVLRYSSLVDRGITKLPTYIKVHGVVSVEKALRITKESHFSLLLRPNNRVSNAGFPTKVVESLSVGTPVILNITSDLGLYINDGKEGFVCESASESSLEKALKKAIELSNEEYTAMSRSANTKASEHFDYKQHSQSLSSFFDNVRLQ